MSFYEWLQLKYAGNEYDFGKLADFIKNDSVLMQTTEYPQAESYLEYIKEDDMLDILGFAWGQYERETAPRDGGLGRTFT